MKQLNDVVGQRIKSIKLRPFDDGKGGKATSPVIYLDNGVRILFSTQETVIGEYGTELVVNRELKRQVEVKS